MAILSSVLRTMRRFAPAEVVGRSLERDLYRAHSANRAYTARRQIEQQTQTALQVIRATGGRP